MKSTRFVVAIDGPAGAGKSTVASRIAARFGLVNMETGAMYRAFALKALRTKTNTEDAAALQALATRTNIRLEPQPTGNRVLLDGVEVTARIREADVTQAASRVSVHPGIRKWMVDMQRKLGESQGIVMEGRDIGSAVFPDADVKIFLDAAPEVRGQRRYEQMGQMGQMGATGETLPEAVLLEMRERDDRDRNRAQSPLRPAPDAVVIDSTKLSLEEVIARVESIVTERWSVLQTP
jgi:cytidylate kinase